ncbi:MAG: hypothetical protein JOZ41_19680 [Chloroflexi bacterium]|nr:hypothetical protein [Chloroflexota bacterium]
MVIAARDETHLYEALLRPGWQSLVNLDLNCVKRDVPRWERPPRESGASDHPRPAPTAPHPARGEQRRRLHR